MTRELVASRLHPIAGRDGKPTTYDAINGIGVAAIGLPVPAPAFSHAGLLYRWKKEVRLFEMKGHKELCDETAACPDFVWVEPAISRERMKLVATRARLVYLCHKGKAVPYGFRYRASSFDEKGGLQLGPGETGFTCSTIVAAILASEQVQLLKPQSWPPPDRSDVERRKGFLADLKTKDPGHANVLEAEIDAPRIRPEEVVAAAAIHPEVGTFESLLDGAAVVQARIKTP